jgi:predicted amidohydrolase YtcJ
MSQTRVSRKKSEIQYRVNEIMHEYKEVVRQEKNKKLYKNKSIDIISDCNILEANWNTIKTVIDLYKKRNMEDEINRELAPILAKHGITDIESWRTDMDDKIRDLKEQAKKTVIELEVAESIRADTIRSGKSRKRSVGGKRRTKKRRVKKLH